MINKQQQSITYVCVTCLVSVFCVCTLLKVLNTYSSLISSILFWIVCRLQKWARKAWSILSCECHNNDKMSMSGVVGWQGLQSKRRISHILCPECYQLVNIQKAKFWQVFNKNWVSDKGDTGIPPQQILKL